MGETWIGVTGFHATENPQPGLAVVRALRQADPSWRVLALIYDPCDTGAFADELIDAHAFVPYPAAGPEKLLARLRTLVRSHPLDVLIPTVDAELRHYVTLRGAIARLGVRMLMPRAAAVRAREKRRLPSLGDRAGVAVPETRVLRTADAVGRASTRSPYPQVLKGAMVDSAVVHSPADFRVAAAELAQSWGYPLLAQPVIAGEEYDVAGVARGGELIAWAAMKKLGTTNKGTAWAGVTVDEPRLVAHLRRLVRTLAWDGAIEAEFIQTPDRRLFCFEINARFPSWIAVAADAGANLPATLVRLAIGEKPERGAARAGRLFARALVERVVDENPLASLARDAVLEKVDRKEPGSGVVAARPRAGTVAITGLNAADNPSPGVTVARALAAAPARPRLVGLTHEVLATGVYLPGLWDEVRLLPFPSREEGGYVDALVSACEDTGTDCLIPTLDIEVPIVSWLGSRLSHAGVATLVPSLDALNSIAKVRLPALRAMGFRLPRTMLIERLSDLAEAARRFGTTVVLKGPVHDARIVRTDEEALVISHRLAGTWGFPLIAQEFVEGEEFGIAAVADRAHRIVGAVAVRKDVRSRNGNTWGGTSVVDPSFVRLAARFAEALEWVGPFELEVIRHVRRGLHLIEVNPRFPAWVFLSVGAAANLPWAAVRVARGEQVAPIRPRAGVFYARMAWDATASVERMATLAVEGRLTGNGA
jgi:carbamoyl-phosphate synthase large subunit